MGDRPQRPVPFICLIHRHIILLIQAVQLLLHFDISAIPVTVRWMRKEIDMRMLMQVSIPHQEFNERVKDGTVEESMRQILDELKPEAVYFTEIEGWRTVMLIVDIAEPSRIPSFSEPWFLLFDADVRFHIVMTPEDLGRAGLAELGKKWA